MKLTLGLASLLAATFAAEVSHAQPVVVRAMDFEARFVDGSLVSLCGPDGRIMVRSPAGPRGAGIHGIKGDHWVGQAARPEQSEKGARRGEDSGIHRATADTTVSADSAGGEAILRQRAVAPVKGVWGTSWSIEDVPPEFAVLVPGNSGMRLAADPPGGRHQFDYPISWEAQLVVVEGPGCGFYVWADDAQGRFKRLVVERRASGWRLSLVTMNFAPFDELKECESVAWRVGVYRGDWRVPARRYRDWSDAHFRPTPVARQQPSWVKEIRACAITGLEANVTHVTEIDKIFEYPITVTPALVINETVKSSGNLPRKPQIVAWLQAAG